MKTSIILIALALCVVYSNAESKPGKCPVPTGFGTCVMSCYGDIECAGSKKCVSLSL